MGENGGIMPFPHSDPLPVTITGYRSEIDGSVVIEIDQDRHGTDDYRIRVNLNDGAIFDGDTDKVSVLDPVEAQGVAAELEGTWEHGDLGAAVRRAIAFLRGVKS